MKNLLFVFVVLMITECALSSCRTVRISTDIKRDTMEKIRAVSIPYNTSIHFKADSLSACYDIDFTNDVPEMEEKTLSVGNNTVAVSIKDGKLKVKTKLKDTIVSVSGNVSASVKDTYIHETKTITKEVELTWWGKFWEQIKGAGKLIIGLLILLAIVVLIFVLK